MKISKFIVANGIWSIEREFSKNLRYYQELIMPKHVTLSISIVVYQKYNDTLLAVESIERFTNSGISKKIYIVDNSTISDDNPSKQSFLSALAKYDDVEYKDTKKNIGFGKGHNYVLSELDSDIHAIINPDIVLNSDVFSSLIDFLNKRPDVGMTAPILTDEQGNIQQVFRRELTIYDLICRYIRLRPFDNRYNYHTMMDINKTKDFECPFIQGSFLLIRTSLLKEVNGFDKRYFMYVEDADLCKTIRQKAKIVVHPCEKVMHRWERASHVDFKLMSIHAKSLFRYFCKWGWKLW